MNVPGESGAILSITSEYIQLTPTKRTVAGFSSLHRSSLPPSLTPLLSYFNKNANTDSWEKKRNDQWQRNIYSPTVRLMTAGQFSSENSDNLLRLWICKSNDVHEVEFTLNVTFGEFISLLIFWVENKVSYIDFFLNIIGYKILPNNPLQALLWWFKGTVMDSDRIHFLFI